MTSYEPARERQLPAQRQYQPAMQAPPAPRMTGAGMFWYVLGNIALGAMYFAKVPAKKALEEAGLGTMTSAERFWYVLMCIGFGAGYFAKLPVLKALTEVAAARP